MACPLCRADDETVLWHDDRCRVILAREAAHPGFCRVIWNEHVAEMSDLPAADRQHLMDVVLATEQALRAEMHPDKINLASFGNMVPHLHWHVIPRYSDDRHFPESVWGPVQRDGVIHPAPDATVLSGAIRRALSALTQR